MEAATLAAAADTAQPLQIQARAALDAAIAQALHMLDLAGSARGSEVRPIPASCQICIQKSREQVKLVYTLRHSFRRSNY